MEGGKMAQVVEGSEASVNVVRINRLNEGHSWNVVVAADDNSDDALDRRRSRRFESFVTSKLSSARRRPTTK
jgi:hypothetical protein